MKIPNFFIVGAPKCGTTALDKYLSQHPEIYMAYAKDRLHFVTDLVPPNYVYRSREWYLSMFSDVKDQKAIGESSVHYLYSKAAPENIYNFNPKAKILAAIRNPIEWLQSNHSELVHRGFEPITDFSEALDAEPLRWRGELLPSGEMGSEWSWMLHYRDMAQFSQQLERYFNKFGRDSILVIVYDDFKHNLPFVFRQILEFLEVDNSYQPVFEVVNPHKVVRSPLARDITIRLTQFWQPVLIKYLPYSWYKLFPLLFKVIEAQNRKYVPRPPLDEALKKRLQIEFRSEVENLSILLDRDLMHWVM